jgi:colanic acid/amylovoran biosynthesis glycosyltransferase
VQSRGPAPPLKVAYLVSRFPSVTQTFVLRELDAVNARQEVDVELFSLFPSGEDVLHDAARPWVTRRHRVTAPGAAVGVASWAARRPARLLSSFLLVMFAHLGRPGRLARALATLPVAAAHARTMRTLGIRHAHAHFASYPCLAAWLIQRLTGIRYSVTAHAYDLFLDQIFLERKIRGASFVVAISEFNRRFLVPYGAGRETPVHVIHCGIRPEAYEFRERVVPGEGPVTAVCVASLQEHKGHRILLEALARASELDRITLELIGDGPLRGGLQQLARDLGLADRVRFRGNLPEAEVSSCLDRADIFVLPSVIAASGRMDGLPVALMEALACGIPAVATRISGIPELVRDGETGLLAEPGDPAGLRNALHRVLDDPGAARARAHAGRRLVEREFDVRDSARRLAGLFTAPAGAKSEPTTPML